MPRPARTAQAIEHLGKFLELPDGVVTVTMKNGDQIHGALIRSTNKNEQGGYSAGITLLKENGQEEELDLLDVWRVDTATPTAAMQVALRAMGRT